MPHHPQGLFYAGREEKLSTHTQAGRSASQAKPVETFLLIAHTRTAIKTDKKYLFISMWRVLSSTSVSKSNMRSHIPEAAASATVSSSMSKSLPELWALEPDTAQPTQSASRPCTQPFSPHPPQHPTMWLENELTPLKSSPAKKNLLSSILPLTYSVLPLTERYFFHFLGSGKSRI